MNKIMWPSLYSTWI